MIRNRRRALTIAVPVVALLFAAGWIYAAIVDDGSTGLETADGQPVDQLRLALESMGVGGILDEAPFEAYTLGDAHWCGAEQLGQGFEEPGNQAARRCLVEALEAGTEAVFVRSRPTVEGDPIIQVIRSTAESTLDVRVDATRDAFGSGRWEHLTCGSLDRSGTDPLIIGPDDCVVAPG